MTITPGKEQEYEEFKATHADAYGQKIIGFAERFTDLVEKKFKTGRTFDDVNYEDVMLALGNDELIGVDLIQSYFVMTRFWIHGEEMKEQSKNAWLAEEEERRKTV